MTMEWQIADCRLQTRTAQTGAARHAVVQSTINVAQSTINVAQSTINLQSEICILRCQDC